MSQIKKDKLKYRLVFQKKVPNNVFIIKYKEIHYSYPQRLLAAHLFDAHNISTFLAPGSQYFINGLL